MEEQGQIDKAEIQRRAMELYEAKKAPEKAVEQGPSPEEREALKQELARAAQEEASPEHNATVTDLTASLKASDDDQEQLGQLIELIFLKGPTIAIRVAESLNKPDILDALHDLLASDQLYRRLVREGKL